MKTITTLVILIITTTGFSQNKNAKASMEVDGVCGMCKQRIEKAAIKTKGVKSAVWNINTHELQLIYDEGKTNLKTVSENLAEAGHDTVEVKATDEAYSTIHTCCKYREDTETNEH